MTDPLTGRQLVEKSYEYIDRLTRECAKALLEDYNKIHKKFSPSSATQQVASDTVQWFEKREKNAHLAFDPSSVTNPLPNQFHAKFKGNTKDADFELDLSIVTFVVPGSEYSGNPICFVKSMVISTDKTKFTRRKS